MESFGTLNFVLTFFLGCSFFYFLAKKRRACAIKRASTRANDMDMEMVRAELHRLDRLWSSAGHLSDDDVYSYAALRSRRAHLLSGGRT